ncbi:tyrosine-type recombinase/integrase [Myxococcus stipitatus]|uniref:tyrosine-type recombinase/integrase n=1 Tax=Myxococcus stipitatus TaxID=83455 RepID=UPI0030CA631A
MSVRLRKWKTKENKVQDAWWVDVKYQHPDGRVERIRKASPLNTRRGAEEYERQVRHALLTGTFGKEKEPEKKGEEAPLTLAKFVPRFATYSENNDKHSTVVTKKQHLDDHITPFFGEMVLDSIGPEQIEDFKAAMKKKPSASRARKEAPTKAAIRKRKDGEPRTLSKKFINNVLSTFSKLLAVAVEQKVIRAAPYVKPFGKLPKPGFDFLTFEEAERLIDAAESEWRTLILVAIKAGLREGELVGLQWGDLDLQRRKLQVRRTAWRGVEDLPKGGRERTVDLPASAVEALKAHRHLRGRYVFCQDDGAPLTEGLMKWPLRRALQRAGILREAGRIGWHDLRHTYASHLAMRGVPMKVIQELMGHADLSTTMRYAHLAPGARESAVQQLDQPAPHLHLEPPRDAVGAH